MAIRRRGWMREVQDMRGKEHTIGAETFVEIDLNNNHKKMSETGAASKTVGFK